MGQTRLATDSVVLDDLTVDTLRQRQQENEGRLAECRHQASYSFRLSYPYQLLVKLEDILTKKTFTE